jgi:hypothetical protein
MDDKSDLLLDPPEAPRVNALDELQGLKSLLEELSARNLGEGEAANPNTTVAAKSVQAADQERKSKVRQLEGTTWPVIYPEPSLSERAQHRHTNNQRGRAGPLTLKTQNGPLPASTAARS